MTKDDVVFDEQFKGYNKEQVNCYMDNISKEYQAAYDEYKDLYEKYNNLREKYEGIDEMDDIKINMESMPMTPASIEILTQKTLKEIREEMEKIDIITEALKRG